MQTKLRNDGTTNNVQITVATDSRIDGGNGGGSDSSGGTDSGSEDPCARSAKMKSRNIRRVGAIISEGCPTKIGTNILFSLETSSSRTSYW